MPRAKASLPATIRVCVGEGALSLSADCALAAVAATVDALVREFAAAQRRHALLRAEAEHVPGGAVDVPDEAGWSDRKRVGFTG